MISQGPALTELPFRFTHDRILGTFPDYQDAGLRLELRCPTGTRDVVIWTTQLVEGFSKEDLFQHFSDLDREIEVTVVSNWGDGSIGGTRLILDVVVSVGEWIGSAATGIAIDRLLRRRAVLKSQRTSSDLDSLESSEHLARWMLATRYLREHTHSFEHVVETAAIILKNPGKLVKFMVDESSGTYEAEQWFDFQIVRSVGTTALWGGSLVLTSLQATSLPVEPTMVCPAEVVVPNQYAEIFSRDAPYFAANAILAEVYVEVFMAELRCDGASERGSEVDFVFSRGEVSYDISLSRDRAKGFSIGQMGWRRSG